MAWSSSTDWRYLLILYMQIFYFFEYTSLILVNEQRLTNDFFSNKKRLIAVTIIDKKWMNKMSIIENCSWDQARKRKKTIANTFYIRFFHPSFWFQVKFFFFWFQFSFKQQTNKQQTFSNRHSLLSIVWSITKIEMNSDDDDEPASQPSFYVHSLSHSLFFRQFLSMWLT